MFKIIHKFTSEYLTEKSCTKNGDNTYRSKSTSNIKCELSIDAHLK